MNMRKLKKINGNYILHHNDNPMICALVPPVLVPGNIQGTVKTEQRGCGDFCPLFDVENDVEGKNYVNLCHQRTIEVQIIDEKTESKGPFLFPGAKNL